LNEKIISSGVLDASRLAQSLGEIRNEFTELAQTLNLRSDFVPDVKKIQAEAGEVLGELSLAAQLKSEEIEKENKGLQKRAWTDGLTQISNRAAFDRHLAHLWDDALRNGRPLGLILLDVDHFKRFNDAHGHRTGDAV